MVRAKKRVPQAVQIERAKAVSLKQIERQQANEGVYRDGVEKLSSGLMLMRAAFSQANGEPNENGATIRLQSEQVSAQSASIAMLQRQLMKAENDLNLMTVAKKDADDQNDILRREVQGPRDAIHGCEAQNFAMAGDIAALKVRLSECEKFSVTLENELKERTKAVRELVADRERAQQNYESCKRELDKTTQTLSAIQWDLNATRKQRDHAHAQLQEYRNKTIWIKEGCPETVKECQDQLTICESVRDGWKDAYEQLKRRAYNRCGLLDME